MTISKALLVVMLSFYFQIGSGQTNSNHKYENAFLELVNALEGKSHYSFKKAVSLTESTFDESFDTAYFESQIDHLTSLCSSFIDSNQLT